MHLFIKMELNTYWMGRKDYHSQDHSNSAMEELQYQRALLMEQGSPHSVL